MNIAQLVDTLNNEAATAEGNRDPSLANLLYTAANAIVNSKEYKLDVLRIRFKSLAEQMEQAASKWRSADYLAVANILESNTRIYQQCADELGRCINGETPPASGAAWEPKQEKCNGSL